MHFHTVVGIDGLLGGLEAQHDEGFEEVDVAIEPVGEVILNVIVGEGFGEMVEVVLESTSPESPSPVLDEGCGEDVVVEIGVHGFASVFPELEVVVTKFVGELEVGGLSEHCVGIEDGLDAVSESERCTQLNRQFCVESLVSLDEEAGLFVGVVVGLDAYLVAWERLHFVDGFDALFGNWLEFLLEVEPALCKVFFVSANSLSQCAEFLSLELCGFFSASE